MFHPFWTFPPNCQASEPLSLAFSAAAGANLAKDADELTDADVLAVFETNVRSVLI
jgi:hypothetical protein